MPSFIRSLKLQIGEDADYDKAEGFGAENAIKDMRISLVNLLFYEIRSAY
jgi:hypothetical protein